MPAITIFGRPISGGGQKGVAQTGLATPSLIGKNATASRAPATKGGAQAQTKATGRAGASAHAASNAGSDVLVFQNQTIAGAGATFTQPLPSDGDFVAGIFTVSVSAGSATVSTDVLSYVSLIEIIAPDGPIIDMVPVPDFYLFQQRWGQYGVAPSVTSVSATTATTTNSATYYVSGLNLPSALGPYTMVITSANSLLAGASTQTVIMSLSLVLGNCGGNRTRYKATNLPFTPAASGVNDLGPLATIQDIELQELFLTGLTSNTADINYIQAQSLGSTIGPRVTSGDIVGRDLNALSGSLNSTYLYPLLALQTSLTLGRGSHLYITWGSSPSSAIRVGYYWFA